MYRDSSIAPLLDMRCRFEAVMDVLDPMIRKRGFSCPFGGAHCTMGQKSLLLGSLSCYPGGISFRSMFWSWSDSVSSSMGLLSIVGRIPLSTPTSDSGLIWCPLHLSCSARLISLLVALGFLLIPPGLMRNSEWHGYPTFAAQGKGRPALRNSKRKLMVGYRFCMNFLCLS